MTRNENQLNPASCLPAVIRAWVEERIKLGKNQPGDPQIIEANDLARQMEMWQTEQALPRDVHGLRSDAG